VILSGGNINSLVNKEAFTRSFASCISLLTRPTTLKPGKPLVKVASISMTLALTPSRVALVSLLTMIFFLFVATLLVSLLFAGGRLPLWFFAFILYFDIICTDIAKICQIVMFYPQRQELTPTF